MKFKELLKPTKGKIILFVILLIIWVFLPLIPTALKVECIKAPCPPVNSLSSFYELITSFRVISTLLTYLSIIVEVLLIYFISSLIIKYKTERR